MTQISAGHRRALVSRLTDAFAVSNKREPITAGTTFSAVLQFCIAGFVFTFFVGLDRAVIDGVIGPRLGVDWLRQAYNLVGMLAFGLFGLHANRRTIGPALLNLVLIPFNTTNSFVTRVGLGFWVGYGGDIWSFPLLHRAARAGVIVGTVAVILDALYITVIPIAPRTFGAGFFLIPNFVASAALGMPFLLGTRYPKVWATGVVVACIFSGSNSAMIACLVAVALTLGVAGVRVIVAGVLVTTAFAMTVTTPLNYTYKTPSRVVVSLRSVERAVGTMRGVSSPPPKGNQEFDSAVQGRARSTGLTSMVALRWRLLWPLSDVRANDLGHIGIALHIATYGVLMYLLYLVLAYKALPTKISILLCALLPVFTDPFFEFGIGLLALRAVWPPPVDPPEAQSES